MTWLTTTPNFVRTGRKLWLPDCIRPTPRSHFQLQQGYRYDLFKNELGMQYPVITLAVSEDRLIEVYLDLIEPLGDTVDVVLESSHDNDETEILGVPPSPQTWEREAMDLPILQSVICEYETLFLSDGCVGIATLSEDRQTEVHLDEHKLIYIYGTQLTHYMKILDDHDIPHSDDLTFISEIEHIHYTSEKWREVFTECRKTMGVMEWDEFASVM